MHHGTCVTHVPWCMSGSRTRGGGENVPGIPGACAPAISRIWQEAHTIPPVSRLDRADPCHIKHTAWSIISLKYYMRQITFVQWHFLWFFRLQCYWYSLCFSLFLVHGSRMTLISIIRCETIFCNRKSYQDVGNNFARLWPWPRD